MLERVSEMGHTLEVTQEARELLGKKGYDMQFGARPLKRAIQDLLEDPLCELLMEQTEPALKFLPRKSPTMPMAPFRRFLIGWMKNP